AGAEKHFAWRKMHVEAGRVHVASQPMPELACGMLLIRTFVLGKPHVAMDAEHRAAMRPRIGNEFAANLRKRARHRRNEIRHWRLDDGAEALLVGFEPGAVVVRFQVAEEGEEVFREPAKLVGHVMLAFKPLYGPEPGSDQLVFVLNEEVSDDVRRGGNNGGRFRRRPGPVFRPRAEGTANFPR